LANGVLDALTKLVLERPVLGVDPLDPKFEPDPRLQDDLEKAIKEQPAGPQLGGSDILTDHAFAVVDLTADPAKLAPDGLPYGPMRPAYAGWNDTEQRPIASLAKLLPLYGAYCMRDNLGSLAHALSIDNSTTLAESGRADYQQLGMSPPPGTRPRIERMFTVDNSANVEFALDDTSDPDLDEIHKDAGPQGFIARFKRTVPCRPDLPAADCAPAGNCGGRRSVLGTDTALNDELAAIKFREQLRLMAGWSDNVAAAVVIRALGFPYLWKLANVNQSRLYRHSWQPKMQEDAKKTGPGGLFLSKDYNCARWQPPEPVPP
jgi:hypothetical protein